MIAVIVGALIALGAIGALPTLSMTRFAPETIFLCPVVGSLLTAAAAVLEIGLGGSLVAWLIGVSLVANGAALVRWFLRRRGPDAAANLPRRAVDDPIRFILTVALVGASALWPAQALRSRLLGYDANAIWLLHAILVHGGHATYVAALHNPVFRSSNIDYPPLVPAASAFGFTLNGGISLHIGVGITTLLNSCSVAILACGIARLMPATRDWWRTALAVTCAASICLVSFGAAGQFAVGGYADLAWAALAAAAVVYGLILPLETHNFRVAWLCVMAATLTKNEGFAVGLAILVLVLIRSSGPYAGRSDALRLIRRGAWILPAFSWTVVIRSYGVHDAFFQGGASSGGPLHRVSPTLHAVAPYLRIAPIAVAVTLLGALLLQPSRRATSAGSPAWPWAALLIGLGFLLGTYVFGALDIHYWLQSSVNRTMIFPQIVLYTELAIWLVIAVGPRPPGSAFQAESGQVSRGSRNQPTAP